MVRNALLIRDIIAESDRWSGGINRKHSGRRKSEYKGFEAGEGVLVRFGG